MTKYHLTDDNSFPNSVGTLLQTVLSFSEGSDETK